MPVLFFCTWILASPQAPTELSWRMEVDASGTRLLQEQRIPGGLRLRDARSGRAAVVSSPRWTDPDNGLAWIGQSVAVGDSGSTVLGGKALNNESVTAYAAGSADYLFDLPVVGSEAPQVCVARRAPRAAAYTVFDVDPDPLILDYEGRVEVYDTTGDGTPLWSLVFPPTENWFGGGVALSDDASVIVAWKADPTLGALRVEAFTGDGLSLSSGQLSSGTDFHARQARLSADGSRMYFNIGLEALVYDVASSSVLYRHYIGGSFDSHAFSGDGATFAYGFFGFFSVVRETSPGVWSTVATEFFPSDTYISWLDLDATGDHLAYQVQRFTPAWDHIELGLYEVSTDSHLFQASWDAPGTLYQLVASGVRVDEAGERVAGICWGDSLNLTPEAVVYDAAGNSLAALDTSGSAMALDLDADGDVLAVGTKAVHANVFGNGGEILLSDAAFQELHLLGVPRLGASLDLEIQGPPSGEARLLLSAALTSSAGSLEIDLGSLLGDSGWLPLDASGALARPVAVPAQASLAGRLAHAEAVLRDPQGILSTSNKVSLRLIP